MTIIRAIATLFLASSSLFGSAVGAQSPAPSLHGRIVDSAGTPLSDARVSLPAVGRAVVTRADGRFAFAALAPGAYTLSVVRVGMAPHVERVVAGGMAAGIEVRMRAVRVQLDAVQVTATPGATAARESPQPLAVQIAHRRPLRSGR